MDGDEIQGDEPFVQHTLIWIWSTSTGKPLTTILLDLAVPDGPVGIALVTGFCFVGFFTPPTGAVVALEPALRLRRPARNLRFVFLSPMIVSRDLSTLADIVTEMDEIV
jgi:hypothetical protein